MTFKNIYNPIEVDVNKYLPIAEDLKEEIIRNGQSNGRSPRQIFNNSLRGVILEYTFAEKMNGSVNTKKFNSLDESSYFYDVEVEGKLCELKCHPKENWVNFNINQFKKVENISRPDYSTFLKHTDMLDLLIIGSVNFISEDTAVVEFLYAINPKTFKKYMKKSTSYGGSTHYYNQKEAIEDLQALKLF